jgi:hypothetical protein
MPTVVLSFRCPEIGCGNPIREPLDVSEANLMAERMSDGDAIERHDIGCDECGADHEVETVSSIGGVTATLTRTGQEIDADVEHVPDYDDFLNAYQPGEDILEDYRQARSDLLVLLRREGQDGHSILNRMIFSQFIAIMEAYLSDKLLKLITDYQAIRLRTVTASDTFRSMTVPIKEAVADPSAVNNAIKRTLQDVLFHKLDGARTLFGIAINGPIFPSESVEQVLKAAVLKRHDCVHRNGKAKDGALNTFDTTYIESVAQAVDDLVRQVESSAASAVAALPDRTIGPPGGGGPSWGK